jgi:general stress protein 26
MRRSDTGVGLADEIPATERISTASAAKARLFYDERLNRLYELIEDIEVTMMTTRRPDGSLVSRPMATQRRSSGAHLWFVAREDSRKIGEIARDPNINLSYYKERTREWISVSGAARICRDRAKIRELYEPSWKAWFPNEGGLREGGPEDPRMVLIGVEARSAQYAKLDRAATMVIGG